MQKLFALPYSNSVPILTLIMSDEIKQNTPKAVINAVNMIEQGVNIILPPRCVVTGDIVDAPGMISSSAWAKIDFITNPFCSACGIPFEFSDAEEGDHGKCMECLKTPQPFETARSAVIYNDVSRDLILAFKHGDQTYMVKNFVPWLRRIGQTILEQTDVIIPVPLHYTRLISRRYNQAALIAAELSKQTNISHRPAAIKRVRATQSQGHLKTEERAKNVRNAFQICPKHAEKLQNKSVTLIDDVYTTGATLKECCKVLNAVGVSKVNILTLARVLKT